VEIAATHEPDAQESIFGSRCATRYGGRINVLILWFSCGAGFAVPLERQAYLEHLRRLWWHPSQA
jgi:hypothetical protein